jgi:para-nitrobenzyl esterase
MPLLQEIRKGEVDHVGRSWIRSLLIAAWLAFIAVAAIGAEAAVQLSTAKPAAPVVVTDKGAVRGLVGEGMQQFLGIPYAAPPVGSLRWKAPAPAKAWKGVRDATNFGSPCPQAASLFGHESHDENCLFLNVYTPQQAGKGHAVMVYIHGGSLVTGEGSDYDPVELVKQGVDVVTINYRLGLLGWLAHPAFAAESATKSSGNYGLLDQQAALQWVKRNIARFGGNPGNVTIFGESAGGQSVRSNMISPRAKGLFAKAIIESGAYTQTLPTEAQAEAGGQSLATTMGCSDQSATCLRKLPVSTLLANGPTLNNPTVDGSVMPTDYRTAFKSGSFNHVPVISGSNHDEWSLFVALNELTGNKVTADNYQAQIAATLAPLASFAGTIAAKYPLADYASPPLALTALGTDSIFACNAREDVQHLSQYVPTYQYEFNDENAPESVLPPVSFPVGATHTAEIPYLWPFSGVTGKFTPAQGQLRLAMQKYWTQFAKTGDPNGGGLPTWPKYTTATDSAESLVPPAPTTETDFATAHNCAFWAPFIGTS